MSNWIAYVQTNADGNIEQITTCHVNQIRPVSEGFIRIEDPEVIRKISAESSNYLMDRSGNITEKALVRMVPDKIQIVADLVDMALISIDGLPSKFATVRVHVDGISSEMPRDELIEIATDYPHNIFVMLEEPLIRCQPILIEAVENAV
jgi:hypothetical protein